MPILNGKKCYLRPLARGDMPQFLVWRQDRALRQAVVGFRFPITAEMEAGWFERTLTEQDRRSAFFSISIQRGLTADSSGDGNVGEDQAVGFCRLIEIDWTSRYAELGIMIGDARHYGHGIGSEATALLCRYGFDDLNLRRLHLRVVADNDAAVRLYDKLGFKVEGRLRQHVYLAGNYHDMLLMAILRDERAAIDSILA